MLNLSKRIAQFQTHKSRSIAEFLAIEQSNNSKNKASLMLEFYEAYKTLRLVAMVNTDALNGALKPKNKFRQSGFAHKLLEKYEQRESIQKSAWDDNMKTLDSVSELIGNDKFLYDPAYLSLVERIKKFGVDIR